MYVFKRDQSKRLKILMKTLDTDTGFGLICASCLQYNTSDYCKAVSTLNDDEIRKYIVAMCPLLKNRSNGHHVCNTCRADIRKDQFPKKSHKNKFKFANFPKSLIESLKEDMKEDIRSE